MRKLSAILVALAFVLPALSYSQNSVCPSLFRVVSTSQSAQRQLSEIPEITVMSFNVENLFIHVGKFEHDLPGKMRKISGPDTNQKLKPEHEIRAIVEIFKEASPDVITLQEVESMAGLELLKQRLDGLYKPYLIEGNDGRGIDIGFLVKVDLPLDVQLKTNRDKMWHDPTTGKQEKLFSRDLPALEFRVNRNQENPSFVLLGNHAKSKRDRPNDPESRQWRTAQYIGAAEIVGEYIRKGVRTMLGGDFNIDIGNDREADALKQYLTSAFDAADQSLPPEQRITHTYHPRGGATHRAQMDDIWVSQDLRNQVAVASIYQYRFPDGSLMPIPNSFKERERQPSDHRPVIIRMRTQILFGSN